jgi:hypothetical protein
MSDELPGEVRVEMERRGFMRQLLSVLICASLIISTTGCASAGRTQATIGPQPGVVETAAMGDYVQRLPAGSRVRVERTDGEVVRGTLMKASADAIVVQKNTRVPEPPLAMPLSQVARVTVEGGSGMSTGKAIGIGIASGVGAFFAILAIFAATFSD